MRNATASRPQMKDRDENNNFRFETPINGINDSLLNRTAV